MKDIERESLDAHVSLCELRYQQLERRINSVETQLDSVQQLLMEIRDSVAKQPSQEHLRWIQIQWGIIGSLGGVTAWALARLLLP